MEGDAIVPTEKLKALLVKITLLFLVTSTKTGFNTFITSGLKVAGYRTSFLFPRLSPGFLNLSSLVIQLNDSILNRLDFHFNIYYLSKLHLILVVGVVCSFDFFLDRAPL